ncbi:hypothetical protein [Massilibacterium senegalense]|uniref:hypothetical protein n=1 Tax=Massilibacterium senegalense TaxID=1632858 RepID=UPI000783861B|nr:hypothetical protein [Massilibacterium senegalense]
MDFERRLSQKLQDEAEKIHPSDELNSLIANSYRNYFRNKNKKMRMKRHFVAIVICFAILLPVSVVAGPSLVESIFGTKEELKIFTDKDYREFNEGLEVYEQYLSEEEFANYVELLKKEFKYFEKMAVYEDGKIVEFDRDKLNEKEKKELEKVWRKFTPYSDKVHENFSYSLKEVRKIVSFPVQRPTYISEGYRLEKEIIEAEIMLGKPKPMIIWEYKENDGEFGYRIFQSELISGKENPYEQWKFDIQEQYTLKGNEITFGQYSDSNVKGMKMIVPEKNGEESFQIVIIDEVLNKQELEKIMLSCIEKTPKE